MSFLYITDWILFNGFLFCFVFFCCCCWGGMVFLFWDKVLLCSSWTHRDLLASLSQVLALKSYTTHHTWHELVILIWLMAHGSWSILGSMRYTVTSLFLFMSLKTVSPLEPDSKADVYFTHLWAFIFPYPPILMHFSRKRTNGWMRNAFTLPRGGECLPLELGINVCQKSKTNPTNNTTWNQSSSQEV